MAEIKWGKLGEGDFTEADAKALEDCLPKASESKEVPEDWYENAEESIYQAQEALIEKQFGKGAAEGTNYGWSVSTNHGVVEVCSKVYGHGVVYGVLRHPDTEPKLEFGHYQED